MRLVHTICITSFLNKFMPMVLKIFRYGDRVLFERHPMLDDAEINIRFHSHKEKFDKQVLWGIFRKYPIEDFA